MGRKSALYVSIVLIYVANITMMTSDTIAGLYAGRLIIGLGNGLLMTFSQLYIQVATICKRRLYIERSLTRCFPRRNAPQPATELSC
jgi:SP family sugar:H+ symporter-like MFS transporter